MTMTMVVAMVKLMVRNAANHCRLIIEGTMSLRQADAHHSREANFGNGLSGRHVCFIWRSISTVRLLIFLFGVGLDGKDRHLGIMESYM